MSSKEDYINPTTYGNLSWHNVSSCTSDSCEVLENWQNGLHEVSMCKCTRITRVVRRVGAKACPLPTYEGFPNLASFLEEFEERVTESQQLSALDYVLKATPTRWWGTHKQSISKCPQCRILMQIIFGEEISCPNHKYTRLTNPMEHIENCHGKWKEYT